MVPVRNIGGRNRRKGRLDAPVLLRVLHLPHRMPDAVLRDKVVERLPGRHLVHHPVHRPVGPVGQENGTGVRVCRVHMADAVDLFILPCIFVLFDDAL